MQTISHVALSILLTLLVPAQSSPKTYSLDFIGDRPRPETQLEAAKLGIWARPLESGWEAESGPVPLRATLVSLDRAGYTIGDEVVFEIVLKHVGDRPFPFPLSQDRVLFNKDVTGMRRAVFLLSLKDDVLGSQIVGENNIALGADSVPGSLALLQPGDTVTIRATGTWFLGRDFPKRVSAGWVRDVAVKAQLQIAGAPGYIPIIESVNAVQIQLRHNQ